MTTATFLLIPGAGGQAWYWHRVVPLLSARGHRAVPVDLPAADDTAGLADYTRAAVAAVPEDVGRGPRPTGEALVVVGQSMGGFTAPLVCRHRRVDLLVLLNAMTPAPGETAGQWWDATGQPAARLAFATAQGRAARNQLDVREDLFHDVPADVVQEAMAGGDPVQSATPFGEPWPLASWPDVPTRFLAGADDRLFPPDFQRRVVRERLGIDVTPIPGGHLAALSRPDAVAEQLLACLAEVTGPRR